MLSRQACRVGIENSWPRTLESFGHWPITAQRYTCWEGADSANQKQPEVGGMPMY